MSKHTPGPWYADKEGYIYRRPLSELYEYGGGIAGDKPLAAAWKGWYEEGQIGYPVKANARLIAAAPEMYELISDLSQAYDDSQSGHELASRLYDLRCMALRLLDKIEGGGE